MIEPRSPRSTAPDETQHRLSRPHRTSAVEFPSSDVPDRPHRQCHRPSGGGSPTTGRTNPSAFSSRRRASPHPLASSHHDRELHAPLGAVDRLARFVTRDPPTSITMRSPRSCSFALKAIRSTIRFPKDLAEPIIAPVESVLRTSLVQPCLEAGRAGHHFGPTTGLMMTSHVSASTLAASRTSARRLWRRASVPCPVRHAHTASYRSPRFHYYVAICDFGRVHRPPSRVHIVLAPSALFTSAG